MTVEVVLDAEEGWNPKELPPVKINIGGTVYTAHCPKDSLPVFLANLEARVNEDPAALEGVLTSALQAILEPEDAAELFERLLDMADRKITLAYILHAIGKVQEHYAPELERQYADMGVQRNPERRAPADRTPARSTSRKPAARKSARAR